MAGRFKGSCAQAAEGRCQVGRLRAFVSVFASADGDQVDDFPGDDRNEDDRER